MGSGVEGGEEWAMHGWPGAPVPKQCTPAPHQRTQRGVTPHRMQTLPHCS